MHYHFNQKNHDIKYFNCTNNNRARKTCTSTHYIRVDFLEQVVLGEIRRLTKFATKYEKDFVKMVVGHSKQTIEFERQSKKKELTALIARDTEIDRLFNSIFEACDTGKIDDDRFAKMSKQYTDEQKEVSARIKVLQAEFDKSAGKTVQTDVFMKTVRKYTRAKELTDRMLNELIDKIEVHQSERIDGVNVQKLTIHYNCIGSIEIPEFEKIPEVSVTIPTRQGVETSYVSTAIAI